MITSLSIKNLALIENLSVEFKTGFSVFTGETGAGKSILLGAIALLLGDRASSESIRSGEEEAEINGVFELEKLSNPLQNIIKESSIPLEDNMIIIRRTIQKNGRNRIFINQIPVPLSTLKKLGDQLIDLHGQHDHQLLLKPESADIIVNNLKTVAPEFEKFSKVFSKYQTEKQKLDAFIKEANALIQKRDLLEFQYTELTELGLVDGEENELDEEYKLLSSANDRMAAAKNILNEISDEENGAPISRRLIAIEKQLTTLAKNDNSAKDWLDALSEQFSFFSELENFSSSYLSDLESAESSAERLDYINRRLAALQGISKKYSLTISQLIAKTQELKNSLDSIENRDAEKEMLELEVKKAYQKAVRSADELSKVRATASEKFDRSITTQMSKLGFSEGALKTIFDKCETLTINGNENSQFAVKTNAGEPFHSLIKTASGGEISRIMLAIKSTLSESDSVPVLIFDEIDTGIGGKLATSVANEMKNISKKHQLLCISHLHQIAAVADNHYEVFKYETAGRTVTEIKSLSIEQRVEEIARMLGGESEVSKSHARELLGV